MKQIAADFIMVKIYFLINLWEILIHANIARVLMYEST